MFRRNRADPSSYAIRASAVLGAALVLAWSTAQQHTAAQTAPVQRAATDSAERSRRALFDEWAKIREPLAGPSAAIGSYAAGCLQGAEALPLDGDGYAVMRPSRHRFYGHPSLTAYLTDLASTVHARYGTLLLVGDMAPPRGGPMLSGHASHQNGLDADVWLSTLTTRPTDAEREQLRAAGFVAGRKRLRPNWGETQARLLVAAADNDRVNRIFVSPPIKRYMCQNYQTARWLYRLRPWWGHEDHFHVRLVCPPGDASCNAQEALDPADNGCGKTLDWWFSAEADREWRRLSTSTEPRKFPALPQQCTAMPR